MAFSFPERQHFVCRIHPNYSPVRDGPPPYSERDSAGEAQQCVGCEALHVANMYFKIGLKHLKANERSLRRVQPKIKKED